MTDLSTKPTRRYPSLPDPGDDLKSHSEFLRALRAAVQTHERRDRDVLNSFVRLGELVDLGLVKIQGNQVVVHPTFAALLAGGGSGGGGVTDHGALTGLSDDDHPQYVLRSILTTDGDIFYRNAGAIARLGVGSNGDVLTLADGLPSWAAPSGGSGGGAFVYPIDKPPASADAADDEFADSSFDTALWTWRNQGAATATQDGDGWLKLLAPASATTSHRIIEQPVAAATWKFRTKLVLGFASEVNFAYAGFVVVNNTSGRLLFCGLIYNGGYMPIMQRWTSATEFSANVATSNTDLMYSRIPWYLEVENNATNIIFRISPTGFDGTFRQLASDPIASFLTAAGGSVDRIGLTVNSQNNAIAIGNYDWFRRIS